MKCSFCDKIITKKHYVYSNDKSLKFLSCIKCEVSMTYQEKENVFIQSQAKKKPLSAIKRFLNSVKNTFKPENIFEFKGFSIVLKNGNRWSYSQFTNKFYQLTM